MNRNIFESGEASQSSNEVVMVENTEPVNLPNTPAEAKEEVVVSCTIENLDSFPGKITPDESGKITILRKNLSEKYDLYLEALRILGEHGKVSERVASFLFKTRYSAQELKSLDYWNELVSILEENRLNQPVALRNLSVFFRRIEEKSRPALTGSRDSRFSPKMRLSSQARTKGHHHKGIGHT